MTTQKVLTKKALSALKDNVRARTRIALALEKSDRTVVRYIEENDVILTTASSLDILEEELCIKKEKLVEEV